MNNSTNRFALLTYSFSDNSGSVLQAFALKRAIEKITDATVTTINYQKTGGGGRPVFGYNVFYGNVKTWTPQKIVAWIGQIVLFPIRIRKHYKFSKTYLNFNSNSAIAKKDLYAASNKFDKVVVGSDQVWGSNDSTYFLDFVDEDRKKVSYAASFGKDCISNEQAEKCILLLKRFYATSVREYQGVELFTELTGMETKMVLDPSLLLSASEWDSLAKIPEQGKYVVMYILEENSEVTKMVEKYAENNNCKIIRLRRSRIIDKKGRALSVIGPEEWLGYIKKADAIFTNSFHGICFSMIFHKKFFCVLRKDDRDTRLASILRMFDLNDRILNDNCDFDKEIDYEQIDAVIEEKKKTSIEYLKSALEVEP